MDFVIQPHLPYPHLLKGYEVLYLDYSLHELSAVVVPVTVFLLIFMSVAYCLWEWVHASPTPVAEGPAPRKSVGHLAIVMDGNRRFGRSKCGSSLAGHYHGANKLLEVLEWCISLDVAVLTVYAFSTENWKRDKREIDTLMKLFREYFGKVMTFSIERNIHVHFLCSDKGRLPTHIVDLMNRVEKATARNTGLCFNVCVSYGGRGEIVNACRSIAQRAKNDPTFSPEELSEDLISEHMLTFQNGGDPDLVIRTSGEHRMSNFLVWQTAYSELAFIDETWPEVTKEQFCQILSDFQLRSRRFGK